MSKAKQHFRIVIGDVSPEGLPDIADALIDAWDEDRIGWYQIEVFNGPAYEHPLSKSAKWEVEDRWQIIETDKELRNGGRT